MAEWKKIITSGSNASLNHITASGVISGSGEGITNVKTANLSGTITSAQLAGSIENSKLDNDGMTIAGVDVSLGDTITAATIIGAGKQGVSGSFTAASSSFSTRVTANDAKLTANTSNVTNAGALMDSELAEIATVKALTAAGISGSFTAVSASIASDIAAASGDITSVTAGNGLTGGGTSGGVTLAVGAGTGVTVNAGNVAIGQAVGTGDSPTFASLTLSGDLTVNGTTTTVSTTNTLVKDQFMLLNSGSSTGDGGIIVSNGIPNSGSSFAFDDSANRWGFSGSVGQSDKSITPDAYVSAVVTSDKSYYRKNGNIRVDGEDIFIYVE